MVVKIIECGSLWENIDIFLIKDIRNYGKM